MKMSPPGGDSSFSPPTKEEIVRSFSKDYIHRGANAPTGDILTVQRMGLGFITAALLEQRLIGGFQAGSLATQRLTGRINREFVIARDFHKANSVDKFAPETSQSMYSAVFQSVFMSSRMEIIDHLIERFELNNRASKRKHLLVLLKESIDEVTAEINSFKPTPSMRSFDFDKTLKQNLIAGSAESTWFENAVYARYFNSFVERQENEYIIRNSANEISRRLPITSEFELFDADMFSAENSITGGLDDLVLKAAFALAFMVYNRHFSKIKLINDQISMFTGTADPSNSTDEDIRATLAEVGSPFTKIILDVFDNISFENFQMLENINAVKIRKFAQAVQFATKASKRDYLTLASNLNQVYSDLTNVDNKFFNTGYAIELTNPI